MSSTRKNTPPEKFTTYFNVLDACRQKGCPVCILIEQNLRRHIDNLLYENVNDPGTRSTLRASRGMCAPHANVLLKAGDAFGISIIYEDIIRDVLSAIAQQSTRALRASRPCPVCQFKLAEETRYTKIFVDHADQQELQIALKQSSGLCLLHLRKVCDQLPDEKTQGWLRTLHAEKLAAVRTHMREFIRKHEMQFSHEVITEAERESCIVAVDTLVGMNI
ncbi:MAG: DUF6062 family protein [Bacteroidota bacterium]